MRYFLVLMLSSVLSSISFFAAAETALTIEDAWAKQSIPGAENGAAYFVVYNPTDTDVTVIDGDATISRAAEVHEHKHVDGMMRMQRVPELVIPAQSRVTFKPGGLHLMMFGVHKPLQVGETFEASLTTDTGEIVTFPVEVRKI